MLGLGLWDTVLAVGNAIGVTIFGLFVPMGQKTGVTQMVLARVRAPGRLSAGAVSDVMATGWIAVNTWIILGLAVGLVVPYLAASWRIPGFSDSPSPTPP